MILNIDFLKSNCNRLYFFGLGFIQVKLNESERVHFYTNVFQKTVVPEEVHNHRYDFESTIIKGTLVQELFSCHLAFDKGGYWITKETCNPATKKEFDRQRCAIKLLQRQTFGAGSSYWTDHNTFHRAESNDAITYLKRGPYMKDEADVIYPVDFLPTCPFSVKVSDDELWEVIRSMI
jgi:hypothetical protein